MSPKPLRPARRARTISALHSKGPGCAGCPLEHRGLGFVPPSGPVAAPVLLVGEAAGYDEIATGQPFVGAAGSMLTKILRMNNLLREDFRIGNTVSCAPPGLVLEGAPYAPGAITQCAQYLDPILAEGHPVVVTLGAVALRRILQLGKQKGVRVNEFHGTITRDPSDRFWVVPTFHPSYLQRGATNLLGTVSFDLQVAMEVARDGVTPDPARLIGDPPLDWFRTWVDQYLAALAADPEGVWLAVDIETPDKGADEGELYAKGADASYQILRVNLACHPDEGVTVPAAPEYLAELHRLFAAQRALNGLSLMWFRGFDLPRLLAAGLPLNPRRVWDLMWLAKTFKSDLPSGLGFWAPFYSRFGAWKHWAGDQPVKYAAADGIQTLRIGYGLISDVIDAGQWPVFERHLHDFHTEVLQPASDVGVPIDRQRLTDFGIKLDQHAHRLLTRIQEVVPEELRPLTPKEGLKQKPAEDAIHTKGRTTKKDGTAKKEAPDPIKAEFYAAATLIEKLVIKEVLACTRCGQLEVARTHRCADKDPLNERSITLQPATVTRYFWQEPFNADSPQQLLAYMAHRGHPAGTNKKTGADSSDRETLEKLTKTGDPLYQYVLDYRAVAKVRGTYVKGTERRLDKEDRLHPTFTFKPSTMRLCVAKGTLIEVVRDVAAYPRGIPIESVEAGMLAYTFDEWKHLQLRSIVWAGQTGTKKVLRLHWMAGFGSESRRFGYVDVTPEHRVRLVDGSYKAAQDLVQGDRTLALTRGVNPWGYARLWATGHRSLNEHRFIFKAVHGLEPEHVHHQNHRKLDNRLENLVGNTASEHLSYHGNNPSDALREKRRVSMLKRWQEAPEQFAGRATSGALNLSKEWLVAALAEAKGRPTVVAKKHGIDYATLMKYIDAHGIVCKRKPRRPEPRGRNHLIVFVEALPDPVDVYDIEVEETHNFIAGEICVHNSCVSPNIQNVITDKGGKESLAAGFRRCVTGREAAPPWVTEEIQKGWAEKWTA